MKKEPVLRFRSAFRTLLSILILLAGVCLMAACLSIYHSGDQPFSREAVAVAFAPISLPVYLCLGAVVLSFLLELVVPRPAAKAVPARQTGLILQRLQEKTDLEKCSEALRRSVLTQRSSRRLHKRIGTLLVVICTLVFLSYGMNPHNFHQSQINDSMIKAMYWFVPCSLIPFGYGIFAAYHSRGSMEKEIALLKSAPAESRVSSPKKAAQSENKNLIMLRNALFAVGIVIFVYGFFAGGTADVLTKAVNICTECVGLG